MAPEPAEREYEEIMAELREESLESLNVTEEEFAEMSLPEIRERVHEQEKQQGQSIFQKLFG